MQPIKPQIMEMAGSVVLPVDVTRVISNVVTVMCSCNKRPTLYRNIGVEELRNWRETANTLSTKHNIDDLVRLLSNKERPPSPIVMFLNQYASVAARLMAEPSYHDDLGGELAEDLLASGAWTKTFVASPSLGYPRVYMQLAAAIDGTGFPFTLPVWSDSATDSDEDEVTLRDALADLVMLIDRAVMSDSLVPEAKQLTSSRDAREQYWGQAKAALAQAERLTAIGLLYDRQADAFLLRVTESLWRMAYDLAIALYPREEPVLKWYDEMRNRVIAALPLHPVLGSIAALLSNVSVSTYYGVKKAAVRHGITEVAAVRAGDTVVKTAAVLAQQMVVNAVAEFARMRAMVAAGERWPTTWAADAAPDLPTNLRQAALGKSSAGRSVGELAEWLALKERYVTQWSQITAALGWSAPIAPTEITVEAAGADFVLCDGDYYSATPLAVLSGLRPGLSMGNQRTAGFARRFQVDFGTGPNAFSDPAVNNGGQQERVAFEWSTLTVRGHVTPVNQAETLARFYMPPGMLMGEQGAEIRYQPADADDPIGSAVRAYYVQHSRAGYVRHWYGEPVRQASQHEAGTYYLVSSWDVFVSSITASEAQGQLLSGYGKDNVEDTLTAFVFRDHWNMRVPVRMSRSNYYEWYNEVGAFVAAIDFDGHVVFDDVLDLPFDTGAVDQYNDLVKVQPPQLPNMASEEVQQPESSTL